MRPTVYGERIIPSHLGLEICRFLTSVRGGFFSISLNLHSTGDSAVGFSTGEIGDVNESVVESGEEMNNTEVVDFSSGTGLWWTEIGLFLFLDFDFLLWWLYKMNVSLIYLECFCYLP